MASSKDINKGAQDQTPEQALAALKKKYEGLNPEELLGIISKFETESDSTIQKLEEAKAQAKDKDKEVKKLKSDLKSAQSESESLEVVKKQGSLQQKYFGKTFSAQVKGKVVMDDGNEVTILAGISAIGLNSNILGDFNVSKLDIGDGEQITVTHKGNIRLAPLVKYAEEVPAFKKVLQSLYDAQVNIFGDSKGIPIFVKGGSSDPQILKLEKK
jgi:hypothetical protein